MTENAPQAEERQDSTGGGPSTSMLNNIRPVAFFAADHVTLANGKLYVSGGFFHILRYPSYPSVLQTLGIGLALRVPWHCYQESHTFRITMIDGDGKEMPVRIEGEFRVGADPQLRHGDPSVLAFGATVTNLIIERTGNYRLLLTLDNAPDHIAEWEIQAVQNPTASPSPVRRTPPSPTSGQD
jgi:hypothetical protein